MKNFALLILRLGIGVSFMIHGYPKLMGGESTWTWLGTATGLTLFPVFWGLCATLAEFLGGLLIAIGFKARLASLFSCLTMLGAIVYHMGEGESILHPFELFTVSLFISIVGVYNVKKFLFSYK